MPGQVRPLQPWTTRAGLKPAPGTARHARIPSQPCLPPAHRPSRWLAILFLILLFSALSKVPPERALALPLIEMIPMKTRVNPLASALLMAICAPAMADTAPDKSATELDAVEVQGTRIEKAASVKYTETLLNTPQTITVVSKDVMDQQGLIGLRDVLSTLPGITFGAGEGGGGYGDSINLRGFSANSDITTDGVRDSAQYTRTDNFNLESIELVNGANSVFSGAGSVGGNINLVSKVAREGDFHTVTVGAGTDSFGRITADSNFDLETGTAVRLNAMVHQNDVPGRDYENFKRWGFAPSVAFGLGSDSRFTLSYLHQRDENSPQYGVPYYMNAYHNGPLPGVETSNYYGYHNVDTQEIDVDIITGIYEFDFNENVTLRSLARFQKVDQLSVVNAVQGTWCLTGNVTPTNTSCVVGTGAAAITVPPGKYLQCDRHEPDRPECALQHRICGTRTGGRRFVLTRDLRPGYGHAVPQCEWQQSLRRAEPPALHGYRQPRFLLHRPQQLLPHRQERRHAQQPGHLRFRHAQVQPAMVTQPWRSL